MAGFVVVLTCSEEDDGGGEDSDDEVDGLLAVLGQVFLTRSALTLPAQAAHILQ